MIKAGKIVLMYVEKVDVRRADRVFFSSLSPWLARSCLVHTFVPVVSKTKLIFGIVHRIRNSLVNLNPYESMRRKLCKNLCQWFRSAFITEIKFCDDEFAHTCN